MSVPAKRGAVLRGLAVGVLLLVLAAAAVFMLVPRPEAAGEAQRFPCLWEDGTEREVTLSSAVSCLAGVSQEGVLLERAGNTGLVPASETLRTVVSVLEGGTLLELLTLDGSGLTSLEAYAVEEFYGDRAYYDGEPFAWDGTRVWRTEETEFSEVVLLQGGFSGNFLFSSGARTLWLCAEGEVEENELTESALTRVIAEAPYFFRDGALWEERYGVERYVSVLPPGCTFEEAAASK